jgi:hypothetical protein
VSLKYSRTTERVVDVLCTVLFLALGGGMVGFCLAVVLGMDRW